jgi:ATP phosphoribosyltransferase regulatory subunit
MIDVLRVLGVEGLQLDIGHPAIFRALIAQARISPEIAEQVYIATEAKDTPALRALSRELGGAANAFLALPGLYGGADVLARAEQLLPDDGDIKQSLKNLAQIQTHFSAQGVKVSIDLGELGGFNYESGITFSVYASGAPDAIARGGRYDEVGKAFGRARPATGFSMDLRCLLPLTSDLPKRCAILGPKKTDATALIEIERLRAAGEIVVACLPGHEGHADEIACNRELQNIDGRWVVIPRA